MPAKPLTPTQASEAAVLKGLFKAWQAARQRDGQEWSQDWCSEQLSFGQSALNQYLNGKIPLNPEAAIKFARLLGCEVADFSPLADAEIRELATGVGNPPQPSPTSPIPLHAKMDWPFDELDERKVRKLKRDDALRLEGAILLVAAQFKLDLRRPGDRKGNRKQA